MKQRGTDIFSDFERIRERMEQAWRQVLGPPGAPRFSAPLIEVSIDVYETEREVVVLAEIAGISEGEVEIVVDGASSFLLSLFGDRGAHARSSVGVAELPFNIPVEVEMIVEVVGR